MSPSDIVTSPDRQRRVTLLHPALTSEIHYPSYIHNSRGQGTFGSARDPCIEVSVQKGMMGEPLFVSRILVFFLTCNGQGIGDVRCAISRCMLAVKVGEERRGKEKKRKGKEEKRRQEMDASLVTYEPSKQVAYSDSSKRLNTTVYRLCCIVGSKDDNDNNGNGNDNNDDDALCFVLSSPIVNIGACNIMTPRYFGCKV
ncbi:hypothetical protein FGSG_12749 [Fusarium graminearum PH-1]|uniref:Chromosome 3, complete genome n=1 Tax=Gibberella zeae (strain ATCC MYA-4620 / CBS 123657 / FGSC 9075 / NRRL 31084 / PH-1) TaxID=229533 RepID=I1S7C6_GIBZE|nr:hypothetical protein FGSG_12749 [Fusarium graminearum PH-1]ESU11472.1 hypothetical protein FGSG_12749 [Fusarium graminearum PH-1]CEF86515.1 unnamed protein product [Fusarium graminearum]|eukprot:XP_011324048.1 hypothetical protein FGSG_12749 [Fusarium graminearum PH-1]